MEKSSHKQAIVIRADLNMPIGKAISQGAHASMGALLAAGKRSADGLVIEIPLYDANVGPWLEGAFTKVVLSGATEEQLRALHEKACQLSIPTALIVDSGLTVFGGIPTVTALAVGPAPRELVDQVTGKLSLYK